MKYIRQFAIIALISFLGEVMNYFIPLPVPASIWGLILMLTALCTKILKVEQVKDAATFLLDIMPLMFVPAAVGIMDMTDLLKGNLAAYLIITLSSTVAVMLVSGYVTQFVRKRTERKKKK